jgi:hypothetical protein
MSDIQKTFGNNAEPQESVRARLGILRIVGLMGMRNNDGNTVRGAWDTPVDYEVAIPLIVCREGERSAMRRDVSIRDFEQLSRDPGLSASERDIIATAFSRHTQARTHRALGINS